MFFSRRRLFFCAALVLLLVVFDLYSSESWLPYPINLGQDASHYHQSNVAVPLSASHHINREPKTIRHSWKITRGYRSPDGVRKLVYLINDQFPGPLIETRSGDELEINVYNGLRDEGVSIHWHGLWMRGANKMDGAVGLTQNAIKSSTSFTYRFKIDDKQAGTFWYHAHSELQRADGMYGALIIHNPDLDLPESTMYKYEEDVALLIGDWYHQPGHEIQDYYEDFSNAGNEPAPDSLVINGNGYFNCSMAVPARPVECRLVTIPHVKLGSNSTRLRFINTGSMVGVTIAMIGFKMSLVQVDGGNLVSQPPSAQSIGILYPGERMDIIVERTPEHDEKTAVMRIELDSENLRFRNFALSEIQDFPILSSKPLQAVQTIANDEGPLAPLFDLSRSLGHSNLTSMPKIADQTFVLYTKVEILGEFNNVPKGFINQTSWESNDSRKAPLSALDRSDWADSFIPYIQSGASQWVDIVLNNFDDRGHPFHLHGNDFLVLSTHQAGIGGYDEAYNPFDSSKPPAGGQMNVVNPTQKDTIFVPAMGYVVLRFQASNEGLWFFHCHVLWHQAVGMAMAFHVGTDVRGLSDRAVYVPNTG